MVFDSADIERARTAGSMGDVTLHEMAHVLGFGITWSGLGLLADPSRAKVPVQNAGSGRDGHWRTSVFPGEVMRSRLILGRASALSAITIQSIADLAYTVDVSLADSYTIPSFDIAPEEIGPVIEIGDDICLVPITVVDEKGRVARVIPPR